MNSAGTEVVRRVYEDGPYIEIGDSPDFPEMIEIRTLEEICIEYWGKLSLPISPAFAMELGKALIAAATEKGAK